MAHFAELDSQNIVTRVIVVANDVMLNERGEEDEAAGAAFCEREVAPGRWLQTSYSARFRHRYAGIGCTYVEGLDAFILPQPYPSWILDLTALDDWRAPVPMPDDDTQVWTWDEASLSWVGSPKPPPIVKPMPVTILGE